MARTYRRTERVNELLREELSQLIRGLKDPRVGIVTITAVDTSPELDVARVYVQLFGDDARQHEALNGLARAAGYLRGQLARTVRLRKIPELRFALDRTLERAARIERLLGEIRSEREAATEPDVESNDT